MALSNIRNACLPLLLLMLGGCGCEDEPEQKFGLKFFRNGNRVSVGVERIYGIGGNGDIKIARGDSLYRLPMSMMADSSSFVVHTVDNTKPDTLTITYTRDFSFRGRACGFGIKYNELGSGQSTTYSQVNFKKWADEIEVHL